jgi:hypothetical protein
MMNEQNIEILEKIVALDGDCLTAKMCKVCPFASKCLPQFLHGKQKSPSKDERLNLALDTLAYGVLLDDDTL